MSGISETRLEEIKTNKNDHEKNLSIHIAQNSRIRNKSTYSWLSCALQLEQFDIQQELFIFSGYINVFWRWPLKPHEIKHKVSGLMSKYFFDQTPNENLESFVLRNSNNNHHSHYNDIILKVKDLTHPTVQFNNRLPIDCRKLFNQQTELKMQFKEPPALYFNSMTGATHLCINIKAAKLTENLELFAFPFDFQFLNIKFEWKYRKYPLYKPNVAGQVPNEDIMDMFHELPRGNVMAEIWKIALNVRMNELLQNEIEMKAPWIYFNGQHQSIRLRIINKEGYHVFTLLFPLFLVVSCSFCAFLIGDNDERLSYTMTVLLTYAATQYLMGQHLPKMSEMLFCDYYILIGYIVQGLIIIWSALHYTQSKVIYHGMLFVICVILWVGVNIMYLLLWMKLRCCLLDKNERSASIRCNYCRYVYELNTNWVIRANDEIKEWDKKKRGAHFLRIDDGARIDVT